MSKAAVLLTAILMLAIGGPGLRAQSQATARGTIIDKILVRVNGEIFTQAQLTRKQIEALRDRKLQVDDAKALTDDATLARLLGDVTPDILVDAVDELLLVQRGHELNLKFSDDEFKTAVDNVKKANAWDDAALKQAIKEANMSMDDLRQGFEHSWIIKEVQREEFGSRMAVTEEEEREYYNQHKETFRTLETVTLREILVSVRSQSMNGQPSFNVAEDEAAKAKADSLKARADKGEDFKALVAEASDSTSKTTGGLIGPFNIAEMDPSLKVVLDKLTPGQVTDPLRSSRGYQILELESRKAAEIPPFDAIRDEIEQKILEPRLSVEMEKLLDRLRAQALIEWKDDNFKKMYDTRILQKKSA